LRDDQQRMRSKAEIMTNKPDRKAPHRQATAYHEAGHVVMGILLEMPPLSASILPDGRGGAGKTEFSEEIPDGICIRTSLPTLEDRRYVEKRVMRRLAGTIAHDYKFTHRRHDEGDHRDYADAREFLEESRMITSDEHCTAYVKMLRIKARDKLKPYWPCVEAVALALMERDRLSGDELREIVRQAGLRLLMQAR
jgi:hypothetical protein